MKMQARMQRLQLPHAKSPISPYVTLSLGVASTIPTSEQSPQDLVNAADRALYLAKQSGRNQIAHDLNSTN
jgi:diguanylate cyclase (GGDEF)-like protein